MKTDLYTKFLLSIIAMCLTIITLKNIDIIPKSYASEIKKTDLTTTEKYGLVPINEDGSITVKFSPTSEMAVNIKEIGGGRIEKYGPIEVKIVKDEK